MRPWVILVLLACVWVGGCGGDDGESSDGTGTPTASPTKTPAESGPQLPEEPPTVTAAVRRRLDRCIDRWNADIGSADPKSAHAAIAKRASTDSDEMHATVTTYDGKRIAERRDACVVVVTHGPVEFPPFSRVRGGGWVGNCDLVAAETSPDPPRRCPQYTDPLADEANATFRPAGTLRLRVSTG